MSAALIYTLREYTFQDVLDQVNLEGGVIHYFHSLLPVPAHVTFTTTGQSSKESLEGSNAT